MLFSLDTDPRVLRSLRSQGETVPEPGHLDGRPTSMLFWVLGVGMELLR